MRRHKITRRQFLQTAGAAGPFLFLNNCRKKIEGFSGAAEKEKPNIIFICTDYQAGIDVPSVGCKFLQMPNLDRICREGKVFTRHYSTAPVCMPARYTWITGTYPHTHGAWDNVGKWIPQELPVLMEELKKAGYFSLGIGKMHFSPWERLAGFDRRIIADRKGNGRADNHMDDYAKYLAEHNLSRWDYLKLQWPGEDDIFGVYDWPYDEKLHIDCYVGDQAKEVIETRQIKEPFFLWISFNGPHNPWDPPARCSQKYKEMELPKALAFNGELKTKPIDQTRVRYNYTRDVVDRIDRVPQERDKIIQRIRAGHFGNLTFIDEQIGKILEALEKTDRLDKSVIIYSSDHGSCLGDHDLIHKGVFYDRSARVPFIVRYPGKIKPSVTDAFSSHVDIMPTILSLAGAQIPSSVEGKNLLPVLFSHEKLVQDSVFLEIRGTTGIVTDEWKMAVNPADADGELYNLKTDPEELTNLFDNSQYAKIQKILLEKITRFNPDISKRLEKPPRQEITDKSEFILKQGDNLPPRNAPYCSGKSILIEADIKPDDSAGYDGVIVSQMGYQNGYILCIHNSQVVFALKHWKEIIEVSSGKIENVPVKITVNASNGGIIEISADGKKITEGMSDCFWPEQSGQRTNYTTAKIAVGTADNKIELGKRTINNNFTGKIEKVFIKIS